MISEQAQVAYMEEENRIKHLAKQQGVDVSFGRMRGNGLYFMFCSFQEKGNAAFKNELMKQNWGREGREKVTFPCWQPEKTPYFMLKMKKMVHQD